MAADYNTIFNAVNALNPEQKKNIAVQTMSTLSSDDKGEVAARAGLIGLPSQVPTNIIWLVVVIAFALVLVTAAGALVYGVVFLQRTADNVQVVLTVFTAVVGFIAGLLSPSPLEKTKP